MFSTKLNNFLSKFNFSIIILLFLLSKIIIFLFFIRIHSNLNSYWQLSDLELLQFDLINTIKFLHMQQPLWNFLIGVLLKFANGNLEMLSITLLVYHWIISLLLLFILNFYCNKFNLSLIKKNIIFIIFIFHPSIIFYENLPFYAHTVVFLFSLMSVQLFMLFENKNYKYEIYFYLIIVILINLISAFIPLILVAFFIFFRILDVFNEKKIFFIKKFNYFFLIFLLSLIPYIKNYIIFGIFTKGTWTGLQLATTTTNLPDLENERIFYRCGLGNTFGDEPNLKKKDLESFFEKYKKDPKKLSHESIIGDKSSRNHLAMITRSEWCLNKNLKNINIHKFRWIKGRINEFLMPHSQIGIDYDFIEHPKGYSKIKKLKDDLYKNKFFKKTKQILVLIFMLSIYTIFIFKIFSSKEKINIRFFYLSLFLIYSYIMLISSLFGNQEGQRFMHYAIIIQFLFFINLLNIDKKFKN